MPRLNSEVIYQSFAEDLSLSLRFTINIPVRNLNTNDDTDNDDDEINRDRCPLLLTDMLNDSAKDHFRRTFDNRNFRLKSISPERQLSSVKRTLVSIQSDSACLIK